jgi:hypothetical protein
MEAGSIQEIRRAREMGIVTRDRTVDGRDGTYRVRTSVEPTSIVPANGNAGMRLTQ